MQNVLVTGGAGFIGSNFIRYLLSAENSILIHNLDLLTYAGSLENLEDLPDNQRHHFIQGDICDQNLVEAMFAEQAIDTVVHFAAETHVDRSIIGPGQFIQTNVVGTFTLLEAARKAWGDKKEGVRFHHVSTDEVFGTLAPEEPAWTETTPYAPNSPYSASKAASDHLVRAYHHTYGMPVSITNCSNNYGPYQFPEKLIPLMILNALEGRSLPVYGDGRQVRDWLYVEDHCEAIYRVLKAGRVGETYNIGGNNQPANIDVVQQICSYMDECLPDSPLTPHDHLIKYVNDRPGHDRRYAMDITKMTDELGWQPRHSLGSGLRKTIDWYLHNDAWIESVRKQQDYQNWLKKNYTERDQAKTVDPGN
jgi:dTDP-glucose 4,6-dehydratase